ncbi:MAG: nickel-dependent lactate racemase [Propionibacteriaceae bacterium]|jgi:nickel-dependent lactate racemase|nr:nickel-dependent lactate racemase [Propionibacteriaceae bacterium]
MDVELAYGRGRLTVPLPATADPWLIRKPALPVVADVPEAVRAAYAHPVGAPPLAALAAGRRSACVVICDITRPVPNHLFLRPLVEILLAAGVPRREITVLVANGLHRPGDQGELAELVGDPWVLEHVRVVNHVARDRDSLVYLGETPARHVPIWINRYLAEADLRIVTGLVEPHFMAGWSGGRKVVAPGVAGEATIRTFHSARFMEDPAAVEGRLDGNPLHEEQLAIVDRLGELYAVNTVVDEARHLSFINFGTIVASHLAAVAFVRGYALVEVPRRFHTILTSAAGYPLDKTYYQTIKGMVTPRDILAPGGTIIIASEISEGFGSPEFRAAQRRLVALGPDRFLDSLVAKEQAAIDEWQTEMALKPLRLGRVQLVTGGLTPEEAGETGVEVVGSATDAVAASLARSGDPAVAVIPEGPYVVPVHTPSH